MFQLFPPLFLLRKHRETQEKKEVDFNFIFFLSSLNIFSIKKEKIDHIENSKKKSPEPPDRSTRPVHLFFPSFFRFFAGSFADRFCTSTGPDSGSVPRSTGPTGRYGPVLTTMATFSTEDLQIGEFDFSILKIYIDFSILKIYIDFSFIFCVSLPFDFRLSPFLNQFPLLLLIFL
jgi:hypothetical protein